MQPTAAIPPEIEVTELPNGVEYRLPRRPLGPTRFGGLFFIAFGTAFAAFATALMGFGVWLIAGGAGARDWALWLILAFWLAFFVVFILAGGALIAFGTFILVGRVAVELADRTLRTVERGGPFRWSRTWPVDGLRRLWVAQGSAQRSPRPSTPGLGMLMMEAADGKPRPLVVGYPPGWLKAVADDLAHRCALPAPTGGPDLGAAPVQVISAATADYWCLDRPEQPAGSRVLVERRPDGVTLIVPPAGLWSGTKGLFGFAVVWCVFTLLIGAGFTAALLGGGMKGMGQASFIPFIVLSVFALFGVAVTLTAVNMARRQAVFAVVGGRLMTLQTNLFGSRRAEWDRGQITAVQLGPSGIAMGSGEAAQPVLELQIRLAEGQKHGFLAGRDDAELQWMATELRRALDVPKEPGR